MSARVSVRMGPASLLAWRSGVIEPDASLALVVDEVAVVFLTDVFGNRPRAMSLQRAGCRKRSRQHISVCDGRFDTHRVRPGEREPFADTHPVAVRHVCRQFSE